MPSRRSPLSLSLGLAIATPAVFAGPPDRHDRALPCRPTIACTADLVPPGALEFEAGAITRRLGARDVQFSTPWLLKLTVAPWIQLQVGSNGGVFETGAAPGEYLDALASAVKIHFLDQGAHAPSLAVSAGVSVPLLPHQYGYTPAYALDLTGYVTKDFGPLHVDLNVGLNVYRPEAAALWQPFFALALSGDIGGGFGAMIEVYGFGDAAPVSPADAGVLSAATYAPWPWVMFDVGTDIGLVRSTRTASAFVGVTVVAWDFWRAAGE